MVYEIKLGNRKDIKTLNDAACEYDGKLTVNCGSTIIDAKSLLGLFTLIGKKNLKLVASDHSKPDDFMEVIRKINK